MNYTELAITIPILCFFSAVVVLILGMIGYGLLALWTKLKS